MTQEALKLALEALEHAAYCVQKNYCPDKIGHDWDDTIASIKEALAHPWVGLTDEEYQEVLVEHDGGGLILFYHLIEARLREKNST